MNILFASPEVAPFAKTGGLGDVAGSLPNAISEIGLKCITMMPFYRHVRDVGLKTSPFSIGEFNFFRHKKGAVEYIFVVNDKYYDRDNLYSEAHADYPDNDLRFSYFCKAIVEFAGNSEFKPDIIHLNDWQTGLVPIYLKLKKSGVKTLFTIHNIGYQGLFKKEALPRIDISRKFYNVNGIEYYGKISFLKAGIVYSSAISTVSAGYRNEILTQKFGCGMDGILGTRASDFYGIINGVDYSEWDPRTDKHIICNYGPETIDRKIECKKDLIKSAALPDDALNRPLIGVISRLAEQKGIDLVACAAKEIIDLGASVVILGTGDEKYNRICKDISNQHPEYISSHIKFDNELAHKIEAGSQMFLMPSRYEPCGLNQLYSLRYGTLPVVRATGGLKDTIIDLDSDEEHGNGIKFTSAEKNDMINALKKAMELYRNEGKWREIQKRNMKLDFSWKASALRYKELYAKML